MKLVQAAADCGCDALKLQTYTADSITMVSPQPTMRAFFPHNIASHPACLSLELR